MRIMIVYDEQIEVTRPLLRLFIDYSITLKSFDITTIPYIYLTIDPIDFSLFSSLMSAIRQVAGIQDVRLMPPFMASLTHLPEQVFIALSNPVFILNEALQIELVNPAGLLLIKQEMNACYQQPITQYLKQCPPATILAELASNQQHWALLIDDKRYSLACCPLTHKLQQAAGWVIILTPVPVLVKSSDFICNSKNMAQLMLHIDRAAALCVPLLITGETGTGKDHLALICHQRSPRSDKPFLALNCAALPDEVVESELYGHAAGAYPNVVSEKKGFFEQANGGTVLLDEIGEMSARMQAKLLRLLNDGKFRRVGEDKEIQVDIRVICATQKDLRALVNKGLFREDLYYRLNVLKLEIPPLRKRTSDILPLVALFIRHYSCEQSNTLWRLAESAKQKLVEYHWPGNVRELKNAIYQTLMCAQHSDINADDIVLAGIQHNELKDLSLYSSYSLDEIMKQFECSVLTELYQHYPSTRKLAQRLGVSHTAIANKLREYCITNK